MALSTTDFTSRLLLDAGLGPGMRVLEVGCSTGEMSVLLAELVEHDGAVVAVEQSPSALTQARLRPSDPTAGRIDFVEGDLHRLPTSLGLFDAIVGRRVLMYQPDPVRVLRGLAKLLLPGGVLVFQEHDCSLTPASLEPFALHRRAQRWIQRLLAHEGADLHIGFNLHRICTDAGLQVQSLRAECRVQTPTSPYPLAAIVRDCLPRIIEHGIATARQVGIETLQARLDAERSRFSGIYIGDTAFGIWASKR